MKTIFLFFVAISLTFNTFSQVAIGDKAPVFTATTNEGSTWKLADYLGKKNVVVYFYPAAMTGGCTKQACAYRDAQPTIESANAVVVGISGDNPEGLKLFKKAENLNFTLLADEKGEIARMFGVPVKDGGTITREVEGKSYDLTRGATASRWTFIIDKKGNIVYKNEQVDAAKDAEAVLAFLKNSK
ncbi:MAG TPA: peroxiredoxin [Prolixibacteraceae bacterium]|nr:peroxiredoxin [Prolixibacteraceae bacterium]